MKEYQNILTKETIHQRLDEDYKVDLGKYISEGFNIFQREAGLFIGYAVVAVLILVVSAITIIGAFLVTFPLLAGYSIAAHQIKNGQPINFETFFKGFAHFSELAVLMLYMFAISLLVLCPLIVSGIMLGIDVESIAFTGLFGLFYFASIIGMIVISTFYFFAMNIVLFSEVKGWDALELSRKMVMKNFWWILLTSIIVGIISQAGSIACYVGMFVTYPISYCISYAAFEHIFKLNDTYAAEDEIERHLV